MLKKTWLALALVLGISTNTQAQAPATGVPREHNTAPDVVPHAAAPVATPVSDKPVVPEAKLAQKPAVDPVRVLLNNMRKTDEKLAAAEAARDSIKEEKARIEAAKTGLETEKTSLAAQLQKATDRANKAEQQLEEKDKQTAATIAQYQHFSGAIKNLIGVAIVGFVLLLIGLIVVFSKLTGDALDRTKTKKDIMGRLPTDTNGQPQERNGKLAEQLAEQGGQLADKTREVERYKSESGRRAMELQEVRDRHSEQMERLSRVKGAAEALVQEKLIAIAALEERNNTLMAELAIAQQATISSDELLRNALVNLRGAAKDFADMSCPHGLDTIIALLAARFDPSTAVPPPEDKQLSFAAALHDAAGASAQTDAADGQTADEAYQPPEGARKRRLELDEPDPLST